MSPEDEREFHDFVTARSPVLLRTAYLLTGNVHHAQDLLQTALMGTARRWSRIRRRDQPDAYVRRAMYNYQARWWRLRARRPESPVAEPPERAASGDHAEQIAARDALIAALWQLPPRQRAVVVLRYYEDRSEAEVADVLGISLGTVRSQASKALAKLRALEPSLADSPTSQEAWL
ncbi:RNA polymerase sigma-70 factor (sigma-E family) [Kibdelosporangium banguiense]|uniref:RNA polymerase sigma-70 factor (Sigma-E family) n=1 Tax=Kibdelosporangium banguiense TaxID=1365924 RepID=A0ABS4TKH0_9PSEU|nr:SigE family RNA polymerase sigma factor [Kibdelosporangium banguiense]MBP2324876.1 RNA polymerase sigma-70 factor (sigma-E family) [Kibdelosporangium banguiense]